MQNSANLAIICDFLDQQHVLTLCASQAADMWCANCFYLFDQQDMRLYLMTEPTTRHAELMQLNPRVVGTIANQPDDPRLIKGIQYRGDIAVLTSEDKHIRKRYCQRFPVAKTAVTPLWQLRLLEIKMTNNELGFAKKLFWAR
ncbi:YhbP family protein [Candidatus Fukatsuia symbiotica]|uniref:UPF0306 protein CCS41_13005 n=1 Tax=Candidatus Fukatsuia symbiotica TaxID=1878942 RepID=A0A2U8I7N6_9GAMM|nr:YhbP family protein [Candidatus Fukatsuia symbiotica]AWK15182.1 hypothetical protein CCS41_13005 [Candidatus Fukatsuia symbiotica]MEA9444013.1 YhbP family protein [Candidatus Fukatsuia symbiotica]